MARTVKSKTTESAPATPAPVAAAPAPAADAAKVKKVKKEKEAKTDAPSAAATPAPASVEPASAAPAEEAAEETAVAKQSAELAGKLQQLATMINSLRTEYRALEKAWARDLKLAQKQNSKRKRKSGSRSPSGFVKPTKISDELAAFLSKPTGTEMARTDVTRHINEYIRSNGLQDKENGRKIHPDAKLAKLLKLTATDEQLTYFNLQKFMSPHFAKSVKAETA